ncbi:uncharacterized protein LOC119681073 [Teleopsis dalmanni]|uniref:uncharacterized protein LOC119681073 n=1 Tax=Teleopsis dalmanni TaxID=139649 RepID=UPI0018CEAD56|nr:uncharacterized protein LOC119681073 [Teleopsis dalmanni]
MINEFIEMKTEFSDEDEAVEVCTQQIFIELHEEEHSNIMEQVLPDDAANLNFEGRRDAKASWRECQTKLLIDLYKKYEPELGNSIRIKTKLKMWAQIAEDMRKHGYNFTPTQVESKWKSLYRTFKSRIKAKRPVSNERPYKGDLIEIFKANSNVLPEFVLCTQEPIKDEIKNSLEEEIEEDVLPSNDVTVDEEIYSNTSSAKCSPSGGIKPKSFNALEKYLQQQRKYNKQKQDFLRKTEKAKRKMRRKQLKAYKERTNEIKRKNDLLQQILEITKEEHI